MILSEALGWFYLSMDCVKSPATVDFYKRRLPSLIEELGDIELDTITIDQLRIWRSRIANRPRRPGQGNKKARRDTPGTNRPGKLSVYTLDQYVRCTRRFFHWLYQEGRIENNPAQHLERPPLPQQRRRGIPNEVVDQLLKVAKREKNSREYAIIKLLNTSAARVGGLAGLCLSDLDLPNRRAIVREKGRGGNQKERTIFLSQPAVDAINAWLNVRPDVKDDHVFLAQGSGKSKKLGWHPMNPHSIYEALERTANKAGVEDGYNPHNFRHGTIRRWLNHGMPLSKASQLAGHSSTRVTGDIYGTSNDDELQDAHDRWGE